MWLGMFTIPDHQNLSVIWVLCDCYNTCRCRCQPPVCVSHSNYPESYYAYRSCISLPLVTHAWCNAIELMCPEHTLKLQQRDCTTSKSSFCWHWGAHCNRNCWYLRSSFFILWSLANFKVQVVKVWPHSKAKQCQSMTTLQGWAKKLNSSKTNSHTIVWIHRTAKLDKKGNNIYHKPERNILIIICRYFADCLGDSSGT